MNTRPGIGRHRPFISSFRLQQGPGSGAIGGRRVQPPPIVFPLMFFLVLGWGVLLSPYPASIYRQAGGFPANWTFLSDFN